MKAPVASRVPGKWLGIALFCAILLTGSALRFHQLHRDTSLWHMYTDEGWKNLDARQKTLTGNWQMGLNAESYYLYAFPLFTLLQTAVFSFFGIGLVQARITPGLFGIASLLLIFQILWREWGRRAGFLGMAFFTFAYFITQFNRTAVVESQVIFLMLLSLYFFVSRKKCRFSWFGSGVVFVAAVATKLNAAILLPCFALTWLFYRKKQQPKSEIVSFGWWFFGMVSGIFFGSVVWFILFDWQGLAGIYQLNLNMLLSAMNWQIGKTSFDFSMRNTSPYQQPVVTEIRTYVLWFFSRLSHRLVTVHQLFAGLPGISLGAGIFTVDILNRKEKSILETFAALWLAIGLFMLGLTPFSSYHYSIIIAPALVILCTGFLVKLNYLTFTDSTANIRRIFTWLAVIFIIHQLIFGLSTLFCKDWLNSFPGLDDNRVLIQNIFSKSCWSVKGADIRKIPFIQAVPIFQLFVNFTGLLPALVLSFFLFRKYKQHLNLRLFKVLVVFIFIWFNGIRFYQWGNNARFSQIGTSQDLGKLIPEGKILDGGEFLLLENQRQFVHHHLSRGQLNENVSYAFQMIYHPLYGKPDLTHFWEQYPDARLVKQYVVDYFIYNLYQVNGHNSENR